MLETENYSDKWWKGTKSIPSQSNDQGGRGVIEGQLWFIWKNPRNHRRNKGSGEKVFSLFDPVWANEDESRLAMSQGIIGEDRVDSRAKIRGE